MIHTLCGPICRLDVHRSLVVVKLFPDIRPKTKKKNKKVRLVPVGDDVVDFLAPYPCVPAPPPAAQPEVEDPDFLEQLLTEIIDEYNSDTEEQALVQVEQQEWDEAAQSDGEAAGSEADDGEAAQEAPDGAEAAQETPDVGVTPTAVEEDVSHLNDDDFNEMMSSLGIEDVMHGLKDRMSGKFIGQIQGPFGDNTFKAKCSRHGSKCYILLRSRLQNASRTRTYHALLKWLKSAIDDPGISIDQHAEMGKTLRKTHGMRVR